MLFQREREGNEEENEKQKRNDFNASPRSRSSRRNREADRGGWERKHFTIPVHRVTRNLCGMLRRGH